MPAGNPLWVGSPDGTAAITWRRTRTPMPCTKVEEGTGYVTVKWGDTLLTSIYLSPRLSVLEVEERLDNLSRFMRMIDNAPIIIGGDFNARASLWGSNVTNPRGRAVIAWAASNGLLCVNSGNASTCVRAQGESVIDVTWASPSTMGRIDGWEVLSEFESLSDHLYIEIRLSGMTGGHPSTPRRWSVKRLDEDKLVAALLIETWSERREEDFSLPDQVDELREVLFRACDIAMPRLRPRSRRAAYWWSEDIADLRREAIKLRRK